MEKKREAIIDAENSNDIKSIHMNTNKYKTDIDTTKDDTSAFIYYKKAADRGHIDAQFQVALCYQNGIGVNKDMNLAVKYMLSSANLGHPVAQYHIGIYYKDKLIKDKDSKKKAYLYLLKSSKQGIADAQLTIGKLYLQDEDMKNDMSQSLFWLTCAYIQGNQDAMDSLNCLIKKNTFGLGGEQITQLIGIIEDIHSNYPHYINKHKI